MPDEAYNAAKVAFVSGLNGSSIWRIYEITLTALTTYALWLTLPSQLKGGSVVSFLVEFGILVLPLLLVLTMLSSFSLPFNAGIMLLAGILKHLSPAAASAKAYSPADAGHVAVQKDAQEQLQRPTYPVLTIHRAHMMLMTVICILAVDFPVFPREFAKCETYGNSIMDLGVGSFVFSAGLMAYLPKPRELTWAQRVQGSLRHTAVPLGLGVARMLAVKGSNYPEHVTEYGVHWNFFITLALVPLCDAVARGPDFTQIYEFVLINIQTQLMPNAYDWALNAPRTNLVSANKEGLVSFVGYLSIFHFGGKASASVSGAAKEPAWLALAAGVALNGFSYYYTDKASRQLANIYYCAWVVAYNVAFLDLYKRSIALLGTKGQETPRLLRAINSQGMLVFLCANLLTGAINLGINTLRVPDRQALAILTAYLLVLCLFARYVGGRRPRRKPS